MSGVTGMFALFVALVPSAPAEPPSLKTLAEAKVETAREAVKVAFADLKVGKAGAEQVYQWSRRLMEAQRELGDKTKGGADPVSAIAAHLARMKELRKLTEVRYRVGKGSQADVVGADFYVAEAEQWLARAKAE